MGEMILVVKAAELKSQVGAQRFKALPEEEIERLYACVEVLAMERDLVEHDASYMQLVAFTAIHHNYSWFTYRSPQRRRSMGIGGHIKADGEEVLFLDESLNLAALHAADEAVTVRGRCNYRLAGLLCDEPSEVSRAQLGLVYVAQLRQPGVELRDLGITELRFCGMGELQQERDQFDGWSQILIDNLQAM